MAKKIVYCADGTWNNPYEDETSQHSADPTNVYKLFLCLDGSLSTESLCNADEQERALTANDKTQQIAKYIHGVGDSRNYINKALGGIFGAGVIARIVRGYTFISRNYEPGASIYIIGFSRGAYTARALAGLIVSQGLLAPPITQDKELAYRRGAEAWYHYRQATIVNPFSLAHLEEIIANLPAFMSQGALQKNDLVPIDGITLVAVWDTVGAMGFPEFAGKGNRVDAFRFADTKLSPRVSKGFHAVSRDEQRNDFTPTLWDPASNVVQMLFPGAHSDVGGGYPASNNESGLSDGCLDWMTKQLTGMGVIFSQSPQYSIQPNPLGTAHKPWAHAPWNLPFSLGPRTFPGGMPQDPSITTRLAATAVISDPGENPTPYS